MPEPETGNGAPLTDPGSQARSENLERWRAAIDKTRGRVDLTAKVLGGLGTTIVGAVGLAKIGDLYPVPPGRDSKIAFYVAIAGFVLLVAAVLIFAIRLWSVNKPIFMRTNPDAMKDQGDIDEDERKTIRLVYQEMADLNEAPTLPAYEARAHRLARIAEGTTDEKERKRLLEKAAEIYQDIQAAFARAGLRIVRRRTTNVFGDLRAAGTYVLMVVGLLAFALGSDYVDSERDEQVSIAKSCADARKAGADRKTLPAICADDPDGDASDDLTPAEERASVATALGEPLQRCLALVASGKAPAGACDPIATAIGSLSSP